MIALRLGRLDAVVMPGAPTRVVLGGRIDDSATLGELVAQIPAGDVVIDTGGVTFINSIGMREWMRLVRALREQGTVTLDKVADVLMTQLNMIEEFRGLAITSFHAQYVCPSCGAETAPLVDAVANAQALRAMKAPPQPCPECGTAMELGDFPERYLSIFKS
jgi:hypothetical protein